MKTPTSSVNQTQNRDLLVNLTLRELRGRYKRSALGWAWSLLNPLVTLGIYALVFKFFLRIEPPVGDPSGLHNYAFFLICALLPWNFIASGIMGGLGSLVGNSNLVTKVYFPRSILVSASTAALLVSFLIEMGVLAVVFLIAGNNILPFIPLVLVVMAIQAVFVQGIALAMGVLNVYYRDLQHLMGLFIQVWFYGTPIIYPIDRVPEEAVLFGRQINPRAILELNPATRFVDIYRDLLYDRRLPAWGDMVAIIVMSGVTLLIGRLIFKKFEPRLAEEI